MLTLIHLYPPHHLGGYEVACQGAMERFADRGAEVVVLAADHYMDGVDEPASKVAVRRQLKGWWDWDSWSPDQPSLTERVRRERHNQRTLLHVVDEFRPDVASVWSLGMMSWSLATLLERRRVPTVLVFLDHWVTFAYRFDAWTRVFDKRVWARPLGSVLGLETRLPSFEGAVASVASRMIGETIDRGGRWKFPDAELVPIGVDTRDFPVCEPQARAWNWRILYVGRVVPQKGVHTLVRSLALLPAAARLEVVGRASGPEREAMVSVAKSLGVADRVTFDVARSRQDLRRRYLEADVVVFPSEWPEPFGLVPLEAMACAAPVVATATGGSGEFLVDGDNCVVFTAGDHQALAAALHSLAVDPALRQRIVEGGRATASELTMDRFAQRLERLHHRAVDRARA